MIDCTSEKGDPDQARKDVEEALKTVRFAAKTSKEAADRLPTLLHEPPLKKAKH